MFKLKHINPKDTDDILDLYATIDWQLKNGEHLLQDQFLCMFEADCFVSTLKLMDTNNCKDLPVNCSRGCLYVDDVRHRSMIPINKLNLMARINLE